MGKSLATKYRPQTFEEVIGQNITTKILKKVIEGRSFKNCILFAGKSGAGKTTLAKIFAKEINQGVGEPIEIDAASNNGVDNVRAIMDSAKQRSLVGEYKVFIIDECHSITTQGWQAFLKGLEEPAPYSIFIFCTTEPNKIPATVLNRLQRFNITPIPQEEISHRLQYICQQEGFTNYVEACNFISKIVNGCMREAITTLEQCADYSTDLSIDNIKTVLGNLTYESMIKLTNAIFDRDQANVIKIIEQMYDNGQDLRQFVNNYLEFLLEVTKYILFKDIALTKIPAYLENPTDPSISVKYVTNLTDPLLAYNKITDKILDLKTNIKNDTSYKSTIEVTFIQLCRGI